MLNYAKIVSILTTAIVVFSILFVNFSVLIEKDLPNTLIEISILNSSSNEIEVNENQELDNENEIISELTFKMSSSLFGSNFINNYNDKKVNNVFKTLLTPPPESC